MAQCEFPIIQCSGVHYFAYTMATVLHYGFYLNIFFQVFIPKTPLFFHFSCLETAQAIFINSKVCEQVEIELAWAVYRCNQGCARDSEREGARM